MKTVLFAWELGEGLGHAAPLVAIADALVALGAKSGTPVKPVFAFKDPLFARHALGERPYAVLPAPAYPRHIKIHGDVGAFSEVLANTGFARKGDLEVMVRAWDDLFHALDADLVVADYSPTACVAARGRLPVMVTGNGYLVPPHTMASYPALRGDQVSSQSQTALLETVNAVFSERGVAPLDRLPQVLEGSARAVFTLPELDPYRAFRDEPVLGHYHGTLTPAEPAAAPHIFYYGQTEHQSLAEIAKAIAEAGIAMSCYCRGPESVAMRFLEIVGAEVYAEPPPLQNALARASLVISHAGSGITHGALMVGRPQILIPDHLESSITAVRVKMMGVGEIFEPYSRLSRTKRQDGDPRTELTAMIRRLHDEPVYGERAHAVAREIERRDAPEAPVNAAARICLDLLDGTFAA
ncbi:MAG: glycosyltransferase [Hyphomicrobiales bacterium]